MQSCSPRGLLIGEQGIATTHVQGNGNVSTISAPSDVISLPAMSDVNGNVTVEAGLLPYSVSRRIFGTGIAKHYAIVQLVISNHDAGDALIVQSVFLDYSHWLFSGSFAAFGSALAPGQQRVLAKGNDNGIFFRTHNSGAGMFRPAGQRSQARLIMSHRSTDRLCRRGAPV